jgi:integrase
MRSNRRGDRCLGPYYDKSKNAGRQPDEPVIEGAEPWHIIYVEGGKREKASFRTEKLALAAKENYEQATAAALAMTLEQGIALYVTKHLRNRKRNRPLSVKETVRRLKLYLGPILKYPVAAWTADAAKELRSGKYRAIPGQVEPVLVIQGLDTRPLGRTGKPSSHTSQLNILAAAQTFARWLVKEGLLKDDPMVWYSPLDEAPPEFGSKGQTKLSFSQAEKVLFLSLELAEAESGKTDIGTRATCVFLVLMTGLRASTIAGLKVASLDIRKGEAAGDHWILTAPRAKKRGATEMVPYGLTEPFERILGPLCIGRAPDAPMFVTDEPLAPELKRKLAERYSALDQAKTPGATAARRAFLREHGTYRQQMNKWQRGDFSVSLREAKHKGRDWVRRSVAKLCDLAKVPRATAHELRGALTNKLTAEGYANIAQWLLRHERRSTTARSYTSPLAATLGETNRFMGIIKGGRR